MKKLIFTDNNSTVNVEYVTDLLSADQENFTVMQIRGLSDAEQQNPGLQFKQLNYTLTTFKQFAQAHDLKLVLADQNTSTTLVDFSGVYYNEGLGVDNI